MTSITARVSMSAALQSPKALFACALAVFSFCFCNLLAAENKSLRDDLEHTLVGKTFVSKVVIGGKAVPRGYRTDYPVNTIVSPEGQVTYRVEWGLMRTDVGIGEMSKRFDRGTTFRVVSIDVKDDRIELKLDNSSGDSPKLKLVLGAGWQSKMDTASVQAQLAQVLALNSQAEQRQPQVAGLPSNADMARSRPSVIADQSSGPSTASKQGKAGHIQCRSGLQFAPVLSSLDPATSKTIEHLPCGQSVTIFGESNGQFTDVRTGAGNEGFVVSSLLRVDSNPAAAAQVATTARAAETPQVPRMLMDLLSKGFRVICDKTDKDPSPDCLDNYINSMKFHKIPFLASQSPNDAVFGFLVEENRGGCEATAKCVVLYLVPQLGTSLAPIDPGGSPGLAGLAAMAGVDKARGGETGWNAVLQFDGTFDSVTSGAYNVQVGAWDTILGLKVNGRDYKYDVASHMYFDVVAAQEAQNKREEQAQKEEEKKQQVQRAAFKRLGLHSGQSQAQVKGILTALGFRNHTRWSSDRPIWDCGTDGWKDGYLTTGCLASREGKDRILAVFEIARRVRDPDTGVVHEIKTDTLFMIQYGLGPTNVETEIPMLTLGGGDEKASVAQRRLVYAKF